MMRFSRKIPLHRIRTSATQLSQSAALDRDTSHSLMLFLLPLLLSSFRLEPLEIQVERNTSRSCSSFIYSFPPSLLNSLDCNSHSTTLELLLLLLLLNSFLLFHIPHQQKPKKKSATCNKSSFNFHSFFQ